MTKQVGKALWKGRRVLVTGHTGFKGTWLMHWLDHVGAELTGIALAPPSTPNLFDLTGIARSIRDLRVDVRDLAALGRAIEDAAPEVVFHLAAQSLVRASYQDPVGTFATNVMGTVHLLEIVRSVSSVRAVVIVTSDKCYENRGLARGYREDDPLGGFDPYSASKGCAEIAAAAYRRCYFGASGTKSAAVATARAGNVIGGGDWAQDRLLPDILRSFEKGRPVAIRNPCATRPWQHVLDPLYGYLLLAEHLIEDGATATGSWNFGPSAADAQPVSAVVRCAIEAWGEGASFCHVPGAHPHEAQELALDSGKAISELGWRPRLSFEQAVTWTVRWHRQLLAGGEARAITRDDIDRYRALLEE
jgi:CDP-glucose 4,6-dehydratase